MYSEALLAATRRGEELRYVTEHFRDLQALRSVPLWAAGLLIAGLGATTRFSHLHFVEIEIVVLVLFVVVWLPWIDRWYKRQYGTVMLIPSQLDTLRIYLLMFVLVAVVIAAALSRLLRFTEAMTGFGAYRDYFLNLWPTFLALPGFVSPAFLFTLPRSVDLASASVPIRLHRFLYLAGSLAVLLIIGCAPLLHLSIWDVNAGLCGTFLVLTLYDHWLLDHLLKGTHGSFL